MVKIIAGRGLHLCSTPQTQTQLKQFMQQTSFITKNIFTFYNYIIQKLACMITVGHAGQ